MAIWDPKRIYAPWPATTDNVVYLHHSARQDYVVLMLLFFAALAILTAIQFVRAFEIAAVMAVLIALSAGVSRLVFRLTGAPER